MPAVILENSKKLKTFTCLFLIYQLATLSTASCQANLNSIYTIFKEYHQSSIREKLFVHTDKSFYVAGEIAWFTLYDVDASTHKPLELSKVAYVEILDSANKHLLQAKILLTHAKGHGSFYLPLSLNSGNYTLRAYTNWMKNFGAEYFFEKNITIVNVQKRVNSYAVKRSNKFNIQFFPEGGNLVDNIPSRIAFKGTDEYGNGVAFTGHLIDNADTLLNFKPAHAGMGTFFLTPLLNHTYKAVIQVDQGKTEVFDLPSAYPAGYVMSLTDSAGKIRVIVQSAISSQQELYLFANTREIIKVGMSNYLQDGKTVFLFDRDSLGEGISQITIFNNQRQPVCERLYFKKPSQHLELKLTGDQTVYATRKKISIHIQPGITGVKNDSASLSIAVYRLDSLQSMNNSATINSYLLLTSDLKGVVEDPNFYFLNDDQQTATYLDYLMLTNGWRRFKWEEVLKNTKPYFTYMPEYNGPVITGKVINIKTGEPANNIESYISVTGSQSAFTSSVSDKEGNVRFELKDFSPSSEVIVQPDASRDSIYRIDITDPFSSDVSGLRLPSFALQQNSRNLLLQQSISMQVQNIYFGKKLKNFNVPIIDTTPFYVTPDARYSLDDYTRFTTMEEVLREYVILVNVRKREGRFHFNVFDLASHASFKTDPLVLLDGVPVFDLNKFMLTDPLKINKLEVLYRKYFMGGSSFNGILNWTSYKADMADYETGTHATVMDYEGLQLEREFYSPVYGNGYQQSSHLPDFRNVLLWSPDVSIVTGEPKDIIFYTSDIPGKYAVQVQGLTKNGLLGNNVFTFDVKK